MLNLSFSPTLQSVPESPQPPLTPIPGMGDRRFLISQQLDKAQDVASLQNTLVQAISDIFTGDRVLLYQFSSASQGTVVAEATGLHWTPMLQTSQPALCFGAELRSQYSQPVEVTSGDSAERIPYQAQLFTQYQIQHSLAIPVFVGEAIWGLLVVHQCQASTDWTAEDKSFLQQLTMELAMRLQMLECQQQLQQQVNHTNQVHRIATALSQRVQQGEPLLALLPNFLTDLRQVLTVDRTTLYVFNADGTGQFVAEAKAAEDLTWIAPHQSLAWHANYADYQQAVITPQHPLWLQDPSTINPSLTALWEPFQIQGAAITPIFHAGKVWGLLGAYQAGSERPWTELVKSSLKQLGSHLGLVLQQSSAQEAAQARTLELEQVAIQEAATARIVDRIRRSFKLETILNVTTQDLRQLFGVDRVAVYRFNTDGSGEFVAESLAAGWVPVLGTSFDSRMGNCQPLKQLRPISAAPVNHSTRLLAPSQLQPQSLEFCVDDISTCNFPVEYLDPLERMGTRAYLMTALFVGNQLWGLLAAYHNTEPKVWQPCDRKLIHQIGTHLGIAIQQAEQTHQLEQAAEQEKALSRIFSKIRRSLDVETVLNTTTQEVRQLLNVERVVIYRFNPDWSGTFVSESVLSGWQSVLGQSFEANLTQCLSLTDLVNEGVPDANESQRHIRHGFFVDDIQEMEFPSPYVEAIESLNAKAYLITALFCGNQLWGLLAAYQNSAPRKWSVHETKLLDKIGTQFSVALQQAIALEQVHLQSQQLVEAANREKAAKELLQQRAINLLMSVHPTFEGDLTVRAPITEDEVGTIADAYNNTLQSLRRLVMQVQQATTNLTETSHHSEQAISDLARQAQFQFQALLKTLDQIQNMADTTEAVTRNALQVEQAVQRANETVQIGDRAMNRTVDGILGIRETVAETGKKIKRLSESSQKISRVVNVISNFTAQTQLLALNASIEATRAGEYGRGFSVVADEVRSLARQSATATTEIEKLVQEIQRETLEVSAAMEQGIEQVVNGTNLVNETRQSLNAIVTSTEEISQLVAGITQSATEQTDQSQALAETMAELAMTANQTSEDAVQIADSFQNLLSMTANLKTSVGQFKVH